MSLPNCPHRYAGFISYSQQDKKFAKKIHAALEAFKLPVELADAGQNKRRLGKFFRDDDELSGSPSLGDALESALDNSAALIVIASPRSAQSKWVDKEIRKFKSRGKQARVFAVIVDGLPDTDNERERCFPSSLLYEVNSEGELTDRPDEPLAPDIRKEPFNRLITRLVAGLLGLDFDTLWKREQRRLIRQKLIYGGVGLAVAAALGVSAVMYQDAENQRLLGESVNLAAQAQESMNQGQKDAALKQILGALPRDLNNPDKPIAESALVALRRLMTQSVSLGPAYKFDQAIQSIHPLDNDNIAVELDDFTYRTLNLKTGDVMWSSKPKDSLSWIPGTTLAINVTTEQQETRRDDYTSDYNSFHQIQVRSLKDGSLQFGAAFVDNNWYPSPYQVVVSPSGKRLFVSASVAADETLKNQLAVWSLKAGQEPGEPEQRFTIQGPALGEEEYLNAAFANEQSLILSWGKPRTHLTVWELESNDLKTLSKANSPALCDGQTLSDNSEHKDSVTLSTDRSVLSRSRPLEGEHTCIERWSTRDWSPLPPLLIDKKLVGATDTFADGAVLLGGKGFWSGLSLLREGQEPKPLFNCRFPQLNNFYPEQKTNVYSFGQNRSLMACSENNQEISVLVGNTLDQRRKLKGHQSNVTSLALVTNGRLLISGDESGEVRRWSLDQIQGDSNLGEYLDRIQADESQIIITHDPRGGPPFVTLHDHAFENQVGPLAFNDEAFYEAVTTYKRPLSVERQIHLMPDGQTIALIEGPKSYMCIGEGCQDPLPPTQMTLFNRETGQVKGKIEDLSTNQAYSVSESENLLATTTRGDRQNIRLFNSSNAEPINSFKIEGADIDDLAFIGSKLIALASDGTDDPFERNVLILEINTNDGSKKTLYQVNAQAANLIVDPAGKTALVAFNTFNSDQSKWAYINPQSGVREFEDTRLDANEILSSYFNFKSTEFIRVLQKGKPALTVNRNDLSVLASDQVLADQQVGYDWERFEADTARGTVLGVIQNNRLSLHTLGTEYSTLCNALQGTEASAGAISPDGRYLALGRDEMTYVYNLNTCSIAYETEFEVFDNRQMVFQTPTLLLLTGRDGVARQIDLSESIESLHRKALALAEGQRL